MNFSSIIGQETARRILVRTADSKQLPNSFLFVGPEGVGKWAAALALATYLNCDNPAGGDSCGVCPRCRQIDSLQSPNLHIAVPTPPSKSDKEELENYWEILNEKISEPYALITGRRQMSIPVETVRKIRKDLAQKSSGKGRRIVLVEQMDRMNTSSADALLKLIEEPPSQTLIIITTSRPERLLPTIISRCRRVRFSAVPESPIVKYLVDKYELAESKAALFARLSRGSLGQALYLMDEENLQDREIAKMLFKGVFISEPSELAAEAIDLLPLGDRFRINRIIAVWMTLFRDLVALQSGATNTHILNIDFSGELERLAGRTEIHRKLLPIPAMLAKITGDIDLNVDTKCAAGAALIRLHGQIN